MLSEVLTCSEIEIENFAVIDFALGQVRVRRSVWSDVILILRSGQGGQFFIFVNFRSGQGGQFLSFGTFGQVRVVSSSVLEILVR